jgi:hypothetical protein
MAMDRNRMRERLEAFLALCNTYEEQDRASGYTTTPASRELSSQINANVPTIKEIVRRLNPELPKDVSDPGMYGTGTTMIAVEQALGILRDQDELKEILAPDAPSLIADQFHPHVWEAASAIWDTGKYRVAVQQAAVSLSTHIATKAGSLLTDRKLVQEVFKPDPPVATQARLHFPGNNSTETWRSRQQGLHLVAQGAFAGIRNVATHTNDEWLEQVALEHLAVLSVIARWTDETERVT